MRFVSRLSGKKSNLSGKSLGNVREFRKAPSVATMHMLQFPINIIISILDVILNYKFCVITVTI